MKIRRNLFLGLALILSHLCCVHVSIAYANLWWGGRYLAYSAPASVAFFYVIPYAVGILICLLLAWRFHKKSF